jgi:hypothetical protein
MRRARGQNTRAFSLFSTIVDAPASLLLLR